MSSILRFMLPTVAAGLMLFQALPAVSQTNFYIPIYVEDGSGWKDSVLIGKYTTATDGIGDVISPLLTENEMPPFPPSGPNQAPALRVMSPPGGANFGEGVRVDIRHLVFDGQKNIYALVFRISRPEGTGIVISWPPGLGSVSGGGFFLTDASGGFIFDDVNMATVTSYSHPSFDDTSGSYVEIVTGSGSMHRTFTPAEIALAADLKGKVGKYEMPKPVSVDFQFTLSALGGEGTLDLTFDKVVDGEVSFASDPDNHAPLALAGLKAFTLTFLPPLQPGVQVVVSGNGAKGKPMKSKYRFDGGPKLVVPKPYDYEYLRMPVPNVNNIGNELYRQAVVLDVGLPGAVGMTPKGKPIIRHLYHPKWKDVTKTLYKFKNVVELQDGPAYCLDTINSKANIKRLKALPPDKTIRTKNSGIYGNKLIGEMVALKFNIAASDYGHTPSTGFGGLLYTDPGHPFDGFSVGAIADSGDRALACSGGLPGGWSLQDLADFLATLNAEFSGPFDTASWSGVSTVATGIKALVFSEIFIDTGSATALPALAEYRSPYEVPVAFALSQNYPNPFNPTTTIEFSIPEDALVTLRVYNLLGQVVATLADREEFSAGENDIELDGSNLSTGVYYYRLVVNDGQYQGVRKMVLMK